MLSGLISAGSKALGGARFSLISVMPTFLVITVIAVLARAHLYDPDAQADFSAVMPGTKDALGAALFLFFAFLGGVLLRPFEAAVVQLLEGYWETPSPLAPLHRAAVERHRRRRNRAILDFGHTDGTHSASLTHIGMRPLAELAAADRAAARRARAVARSRRIRRGYPVEVREFRQPGGKDPEGELMPTLLGNALMRGERLSGDRYGLDMPIVGPRLYPFISPRLQSAVNQQMDLISASASLCVSLTVATAAMLPLLARLDAWSLLPLAPACMAILAYRGAVAAALYHGTLLSTVFDLHRFDLIRAFHYEIPEEAKKVVRLNRRISTFLSPDNRERLDDSKGLKDDAMVHPSDDQDVLQRTDRDGSAQS
ncbi:hypothetical protein G5C60_46050 [Streptomyces sp. HC44]|uniref:Uncharacterized protein n=1 Tax=Streptomyces scabichelini TaxID=2711217 RepID=A0A6G4VKZ0_9ACTN|nr:hypothetical protein [Streptomyces scabichelini]NGO14766.1 hypothetical protein [Streptomyces scabichelini]